MGTKTNCIFFILNHNITVGEPVLCVRHQEGTGLQEGAKPDSACLELLLSGRHSCQPFIHSHRQTETLSVLHASRCGFIGACVTLRQMLGVWGSSLRKSADWVDS